jgi:hypothetical protein
MRLYEDTYDELDEMYDYAPMRGRMGRKRSDPDMVEYAPVNTRMAFLNRQAGIINRYRKQGVLK